MHVVNIVRTYGPVARCGAGCFRKPAGFSTARSKVRVFAA
jgi:hypothetical protein